MCIGKYPYKVKLRGRSVVVYEEGGKTMLIESEMMSEKIDFASKVHQKGQTRLNTFSVRFDILLVCRVINRV